MPYATGLHPGAVWKKSDLQIHTPRDPFWKNGPHLPGGAPGSPEEAAREKWAEDFVRKCKDIGLQAIAITDHHDFCFLPYIQRAITRLGLTDQLWVFPGVEVTCNDSAQCIVLFDRQTDREIWMRLFGGHLQAIQETPCRNAETVPAELCGKDIDELIRSIQGDPAIDRISIVLPHAGDDGAHKSVLRQGFHERFKNLGVDGVYLEEGIAHLSDGAKDKIYGRIQEWGKRRRGIITTGDNRDALFSSLCAAPCWIRLGEPTAESLREALLADTARITYEKPSLPAQRIIEVRVASSLTGGNFQLAINDGFTAIIGGRGSGKTAVLEYLRFGLGRSTADTGTEGSVGERERELVTSTLKGGFVTVVVERDGVRETWHRSGDSSSTIAVTVDGGATENIAVDAAWQRFKARAYSQKQLSTLVERENAAEQITGIAAAESADRRRALDLEISRVKREITSALQTLVEYWVAEQQEAEARALVADLTRRAQATRTRLEESGLSEDAQKVLDRAPAYAAASTLFSEAESQISADIASIEKLKGTIPSIDATRWTAVEVFDDAKRFLAAVSTARNQVSASLEAAVSALRSLESIRSVGSAQFQVLLKAFESTHAAALKQQEQLGSLIAEAQKLAENLQQANTRARLAAARVTQFQDAPGRLAAARQRLNDLLEEKRTILKAAAASVSARTSLVSARVQSEELPKEYVDALATLCENQRVRDAQPKCEDRVRDLMLNGPHEWRREGDALLHILKAKTQAGQQTLPTPEIAGKLESDVLFGLTDSQAAGIYRLLGAVHVARALTAVREDFIVFDYKDKAGLIPFAQASPGQQAAALLDLLLSQEAGTLIIDQPEDDLDNKVVMKIVRLVQQTKRKRQLVFATHNANFVVNGDADKVVSLHSVAGGSQAGTPRVSVEVDGAIETPAVRNSITETVEGGRDAFELRRRKYLFG